MPAPTSRRSSSSHWKQSLQSAGYAVHGITNRRLRGCTHRAGPGRQAEFETTAQSSPWTEPVRGSDEARQVEWAMGKKAMWAVDTREHTGAAGAISGHEWAGEGGEQGALSVRVRGGPAVRRWEREIWPCEVHTSTGRPLVRRRRRGCGGKGSRRLRWGACLQVERAPDHGHRAAGGATAQVYTRELA
jgi:hypothetical protein